ncbi:beta-lactamase family protein [Alloacidobacterium dinghuense]|uniref:Beta-lactamase family protein n=1 Tax=Alloacidobacterium dinghuense TaxID=2763107 RepID=A0A7G8BK55_9BACT|nr:serine hydrolase domain-containing protein [Alloacidobacterium dinghuense]QNI32925.1 beta-lactamase family protein [Alloacidobacterium dinghuense]
MTTGVDRRTFLKGAAASAAVVAPSNMSMSAATKAPPKGVSAESKAAPASGLSAKGLNRMHGVMSGYVDSGEVPGIVTLVSRRGQIDVDAVGMKKIGETNPVQRDTIFRIASMTKPITAAATMILVEECVLRLDDPVDHLLPELANRRVLKRIDAKLDDTVPAKRPITVRDLLTFRMGFGQMVAAPDAYPILKAANELQIGMGAPNPATKPAPDEWIHRLGTLPLMHQPGEMWMYDTPADVLGVLIARASGQPFEAFLRERIFGPLAMKDSDFSVPAAKINRFATSYWLNPQTGKLEVFDEADGGQWSRPPAFPSGAGGLVSTVDDYFAFSESLLNTGKRGPERILSQKSIELMRTDQLTPEQKAISGLTPGYFDNHGWGFCMSIVTKHTDIAGSVGSFGWNGGLGTSWFADPRDGLSTLLLTQRAWTSPTPPNVCLDFWTSAALAIED